MDGDGRVIVDPGFVLEPLHPTQDGVDPPARPHRLHPLEHEPGHLLGVTAGPGVFDGRLRTAVRLEPGRGPRMQGRDHPRLPAFEFGVQQLPEQLVVSVPIAASVEGDHQQVVPVEPVQHPARSLGIKSGIAERTAQAVEDRRAGQE